MSELFNIWEGDINHHSYSWNERPFFDYFIALREALVWVTTEGMVMLTQKGRVLEEHEFNELNQKTFQLLVHERSLPFYELHVMALTVGAWSLRKNCLDNNSEPTFRPRADFWASAILRQLNALPSWAKRLNRTGYESRLMILGELSQVAQIMGDTNILYRVAHARFPHDEQAAQMYINHQQHSWKDLAS